MLPGPRRRDGLRNVQMVGCANDYDVDRRIGQHVFQPVVRTAMRRIHGFRLRLGSRFVSTYQSSNLRVRMRFKHADVLT
jgi:hypothetical protein